MEAETDVIVSNEGSVFLLNPVTEAGKEWIKRTAGPKAGSGWANASRSSRATRWTLSRACKATDWSCSRRPAQVPYLAEVCRCRRGDTL